MNSGVFLSQNLTEKKSKNLFSVAPMLRVTDSHFRRLARILSPNSLLYTEMIPVQAVTKGKKNNLLSYHPSEKPLAVQFAANEPQSFAQACLLAEDCGFEEVNLNLGCPATSAVKGCFGLSLMKNLDQVLPLVAAAQGVLKKIPFSIKTRIGVDDCTTDDFLWNFVEKTSQAGCQKFILHARVGLTKGLNPKKNRQIPPLDWNKVFLLKKSFPQLEIIMNGGITKIEECKELLLHTDGVMLGRKIEKDLFFLNQVEETIFQNPINFSLPEILEIYFSQNEIFAYRKSNYWLFRPLLSLAQKFSYSKNLRQEILQAAKKPMELEKFLSFWPKEKN